jgi:uncharacterized repeat protein (TIGR03803 family)
VNGVLYGTTLFGGDALGHGTVFKITTSGTERVVYRFGGGSDGVNPGRGGLISVNGVLYGTTEGGGANSCSRCPQSCQGGGCGTVFKITTSGVESVLYRFAGESDGADPVAGLTDVDGVLYGTTAAGGKVCAAAGCGTVFKVTASGVESVLHRFGAVGDGGIPIGGLVNVNGTLYGTTEGGGAGGAGTVYKITTSGVESILHSFVGGSDGAQPVASLTYVNGALYGTTLLGGANGTGTVYKITTSGAQSVLYSFGLGNHRHGPIPFAELIGVNGALYGTTAAGGTNDAGFVFSLPLGNS